MNRIGLPLGQSCYLSKIPISTSFTTPALKATLLAVRLSLIAE
jgi:hypothetical protein